MSVSAFKSSPPVREIWILRFPTAHERPPGLLSYRYSKSQWIDRLKELTEDLVNEIYTSGAEIEEASLNIWSARLTTRIIMASRGSLSVWETSAKHRSLFLYGGLWHFAKDTRIVWPGPWLRTRVPRIQWKIAFIKECQGIYDGLFSSFFLYFECRSLVLALQVDHAIDFVLTTAQVRNSEKMHLRHSTNGCLSLTFWCLAIVVRPYQWRTYHFLSQLK